MFQDSQVCPSLIHRWGTCICPEQLRRDSPGPRLRKFHRILFLDCADLRHHTVDGVGGVNQSS